MDISTRIKKERLNLNLTQKKLAKQLGISQKTVSSYERGKCIPPIDILKKLAETFNVTTDYLLGITDEHFDKNSLKIAVEPKEYRLLSIFRKLDSDYKDIIWGEILKYQKLQEHSFMKNKKETQKQQA
ncbi:MAG: helix-turn-helix domain-containing protein [Lachnospiraceae bacterium]